MERVGRNELCPCGSGKKSKRCCASKSARMSSGAARLALGLALLAAALGLMALLRSRPAGDAARVWSPEHGHWHDVGGGTAGAASRLPASAPPGPAPPGKVWSYEHGHWHDVR